MPEADPSPGRECYEQRTGQGRLGSCGPNRWAGRIWLFPDGLGPFPGVVVVHVDLFNGRNRAVCMARMFAGGLAGNLDYYGVPALKAALGQLASRPEVDAGRIGAIGFCLCGSIALTWAGTDNRPTAIAPFYGAAPKPRAAIRRMCPVVGSWPGKDFTTKAAGVRRPS